jgi:isopentenyldiphosphate isomerase
MEIAPLSLRPHDADPEEEVFDIVNEDGEVVGQDARARCHKLGLLHRAGQDTQPWQPCATGAIGLLRRSFAVPAVYVFVFDTKGRLLIQRRSSDKKIGPGQWDLSVAEHLSQGRWMHQLEAQGVVLVCA